MNPKLAREHSHLPQTPSDAAAASPQPFKVIPVSSRITEGTYPYT